MIDIFKLFRVETKEDMYTYCLKTMIENGGLDFRKRVGEQFGFEEDYQIARQAFTLPVDCNNKQSQKIIPDLVLYNSHHISIIESKMFSAEGYSQTVDYAKGAEAIKNELGYEAASVAFFFLTLSGISAESQNFKPVKWADFYEAILKDTSFEDEALEVIRKTILSQVEKYKSFEKALESKPYRELFNEDTYWITPLTLFSSGIYNNIWQPISGEEKFGIRNGEINGYGHSEFTTDLRKKSWIKRNIKWGIDVKLFIRIEWNKNYPVVWLCWEYGNDEKVYIPTKTINPSELREQAIDSLRTFKEVWEMNESYSHLDIRPTNKKASSIKALKCEINGDKYISQVIDDIKSVINYYSEEIQKVINAFTVEEDRLLFNEEKYKSI